MEFSDRDARRIKDAVLWVEGHKGSFKMPKRVGSNANVPEVRIVNITSTTVDANGRYPADLQVYDVDDESYTDFSECRVESLDGALNTGKIAAIRVGHDGDYPVFITTIALSTLEAISSKRYVRAATTGNITLSGAQTIDGVSIVADEDVLVRSQTAPAQNGIYTAATGSWARRSDADSWDELVGALVVVTEGTTLADTLWMCTSNAGGTLGSTAVTWQRIDAGVGITVSGYDSSGLTISYAGVTELNIQHSQTPFDAIYISQVGSVTYASVRSSSSTHNGVVYGVSNDTSGGRGRHILYHDDVLIVPQTGGVTSARISVGGGAVILEGYYAGATSTSTLINGSVGQLAIDDDSGGTPKAEFTFGYNTASSVAYPPQIRVQTSSVAYATAQTGTYGGLEFTSGILTGGAISITVSQISDIGSTYQPLDGDLTAIAALSGTDTIYYRSGVSTWTAVTIGTGLSFSSGTLSASGSGVADADYGDITVSSSGTVWTIDDDTIGTAELASLGMPSQLLGSGSASADPAVIQLGSGLVMSGTTLSVAIADADYGDITVSSSGTVWTIDNDAVTYAKMQNVSATDKLLGRSTAGAGDVEEIACTVAGRALLAGADKEAQRTTLGVGTGDSPEFTAINLGHASDTTLARSSAGNMTIEGNAVYRAGGTDVPLADGGTGASLADPGADRILFWDDSASAVTWLTVGTGLSITDTTITASGATEATQAEMEAASGSTQLVTPRRVAANPGVAKAWVRFHTSGGVPTIDVSYNVNGINDYGVGDFGIGITTGFSTANYVGGSMNNDYGSETLTTFNSGAANSTTEARVRVYKPSVAYADPDNGATMVFFGDQ